MTRTAPHPDLIAFVDVETTGLNELVDELLEISAIVVTNDLEPADDGISVVIDPETPGWRDSLDEFITTMHTASGLLADIDAGRGVLPGAADRTVAQYLDGHRDGKPLLFGGNSITLDRNFLRAKAPATFERLHYRSLDGTSIGQYQQRILGLPAPEVNLAKRHRGLSDLHDSIAGLRALRDQIRAAGHLL
ncbi:MAG: oligoribonuclease [Microbacteriaceae bacterium]